MCDSKNPSDGPKSNGASIDCRKRDEYKAAMKRHDEERNHGINNTEFKKIRIGMSVEQPSISRLARNNQSCERAWI